MVQLLFENLLNKRESEHIDFKREFYKGDDKSSLVHDVLCLSNSRCKGDRHIVFGVEDKNKIPVGVSEEIKENQNDIIDTLKSAKINRSLYNDVLFEKFDYDNKSFAILTIKNRPDKPFFLLEDYPRNKSKRTVRAGVIYTRHQDRNTGIDSTASDDEIELMWRERFGIDLPPEERFLAFSENINDWKRVHNKNNEEYFYAPFPEFRIKELHNKEVTIPPPENDRWIPKRWDEGRILSTEYAITYHGLILSTVFIWWGDNCREPIPLPKIKSESNVYHWSLERHSVEYRAGLIVASFSNFELETLLEQTKIHVLDSKS